VRGRECVYTCMCIHMKCMLFTYTCVLICSTSALCIYTEARVYIHFAQRVHNIHLCPHILICSTTHNIHLCLNMQHKCLVYVVYIHNIHLSPHIYTSALCIYTEARVPPHMQHACNVYITNVHSISTLFIKLIYTIVSLYITCI